ncbi:MAG: type II secretion system protein [Myxococcota bacterium]
MHTTTTTTTSPPPRPHDRHDTRALAADGLAAASDEGAGARLEAAWQRLRMNRGRRARRRGVTLIEVLIVIAIMALIAGGVGFAVFPKIKKARIDTAKRDCGEIQKVATTYRALNVGVDCPTVTTLIEDRELTHEAGGADPWGTLYDISCTPDDIGVVSAGPDTQMGTEDDIMVGYVGEG